MSTTIIRPATLADAGSLSQLICENAEKLLRPHYNAGQWDIFIKYYAEEQLAEKIGSQVVFCAEMDGLIVGTVALDGGFVVGFYTRLQYLNRGIGKRLMIHLESYAKAQGLKELQLAASPEGLAFYYKNGWQKVKDFIIEHFGVGFEETLMVKKIGHMIVPGTKADFAQIHEIINDAASAYKGIIPADRWHEPYMTWDELQAQIDDGVTFWCYVDDEGIIGVMGLQDKGDVTLIRHAYVRTAARNKGIGGQLLRHLRTLSTKPILIGTWAAASWAIDFYKKYGFRLVSFPEKEALLRKYWSIPERQIATSVVLSNAK